MDNAKQKSVNPSPCLTPDQLVAYKENRISLAERNEIERHVAECELCQDALEGLDQYADINTFKKDLHVLNKDIQNQLFPSTAKKNNWKIYSSIAAVLIIAVLSVYSIFIKKSLPEIILEEYFAPYPNTIPLLRGEENQGDIDNAMIAYEIKNYVEALDILLTILQKDADHDAANFYAGNIFLYQQAPNQAIVFLKKVIQSESIQYSEPALWYLGLAYVMNSDMSNARSVFKELYTHDGLYKEQSEQIISLLDNSS